MLETPEHLIRTWMELINKGDLEGLLGLYADQAIVIPTFSNRVLNEPAKIRKYFETLSKREELSIALHDNTLIVQPTQNALFTLCGIYCWRFAIEGELLSFEARFSFLLDLALPKPILHHHSSQIPRSL